MAGVSRVVVTGAGGQTGSIVVRKLLEPGRQAVGGGGFTVRAVVRSDASEAGLREKLGAAAADASRFEVARACVTQPAALAAAMDGAAALVIVTSAMPRISKASLAGVIGAKILTLGWVSRKPSFWYDEGQSPEHVDWAGQRSQIDAAKAAGVRHVVLVSSMAGTQPGHFLNTNMENIVLWKRKAEMHLIASGLAYTIIHPGGLLPHFGGRQPAPGGRRRLAVGVDDALLDDGTKRNLIPREDVAEVCVLALSAEHQAAALGRSFDIGSHAEGDGDPFAGDLTALLGELGGRNCKYDQSSIPDSKL